MAQGDPQQSPARARTGSASVLPRLPRREPPAGRTVHQPGGTTRSRQRMALGHSRNGSAPAVRSSERPPLKGHRSQHEKLCGVARLKPASHILAQSHGPFVGLRWVSNSDHQLGVHQPLQALKSSERQLKTTAVASRGVSPTPARLLQRLQARRPEQCRRGSPCAAS